MGRPRTKNKHLPQRVYLENGRYWFRPKSGARVDLGTTLAAMYEALGRQSREQKPLRTMGHVFDRYLLEALPALAPRTQSDYRIYIERIRPAFSEWAPPEITAGDIFDFRVALAKSSGVVQANRHISCLSAVFRESIGWKAVTTNPCRELQRLHEHKRTRYVEDREYNGVYSIASPTMQCMMELATMTSQREGDLLRLAARDPSVYTDDGILFRPQKSVRRHPRHGKIVETGKTVIVEWSPELTAVVERARKLGPDIRRTLICNLQGEPFTESGFRSNWHRLIQTSLRGRKLKNGVVTLAPVLTESFTFHDLRAKSASDEDFDEAHERLAHSDPRTTQSIYRRKPRRARAGKKVAT